jgi:hypothetical protein
VIHQSLEHINSLVIHCSATPEGADYGVVDIDAWHRARGWAMVGYHRVIRLDGSVEQGRPYTRRGAHVSGNNINTLGYCLIGGLDITGNPKNTFTSHQFDSLIMEIINIRQLCPNLVNIKGHRDYSPDLNGDGLITPDEWIKQCPCFDVGKKLMEWRI